MKQRALLKVWLIYSCNLATLVSKTHNVRHICLFKREANKSMSGEPNFPAIVLNMSDLSISVVIKDP